MNPFFFSPRGRRIDFAVGMLAAILAVLFAVYGVIDRSGQLREGGDAARLIAGQTALSADGTLDSARQLLRAVKVLARDLRAGGTGDSLLRDWKAENKFIMDLVILSADGKILNWSGDGAKPKVDEREYFRAHLDAGKPLLHIGKPLLSKVHAGKWFFALSEDVRAQDGSLQAVVVAIVDLAMFKDRLALSLPGRNNAQVLADFEGNVFARSPDHEGSIGKKINVADLKRQSGKIVEDQPFVLQSPIDGKNRIVVVRRLPNYPLVAVGSTVMNEVLAPWYERLAITIVLWLLIAGGLFWVGQRLKADLALQETLANTDSLTGIHNRRAILSAASDLSVQDQDKGMLSVMMIDVDHFKKVNDTFGHKVGDEVLRKVSATLRSQCRSTDIVGRYGGEEFLVLMPNTDLDGAASVAEKLRAAVERLAAEPTAVTISIGVASAGLGENSLQRAIELADQALYEAKAAGRNCIQRAARDRSV